MTTRGATTADGLRVALIASARYPISQPFAGGLEAHTWQLAHGLRARGHQVSVFAAPGSDPELGATGMPQLAQLSEHAREDVSMPSERFLIEHHAYLGLMLDLAERTDFDVVHNNSLHYLPVAMARSLDAPLVTTLHTPPTPWLESALGLRPDSCARFAAVSRCTAEQWRPMVGAAEVVPNGVDLNRWRPGPGGGDPVWSGRLTPEKGPEVAIRAARKAGVPLRLAGPVSNPDYFAESIEPLLGGSIRYVGHLSHEDLAELVGSASVAVVSPCWEEPYGLVVAEAMACGTPVAGFRRGALPELVGPAAGVLADPDDVDGLAAAITAAALLDRAAVRRHAERTCSVEAMIDGYERVYRGLAA